MVATNLEQAVDLERRLTNLPAVSGIESMTRFLSEDQTAKLALVGAIKEELSGICFSEADTNLVNLDELSGALYSLYGYLGAAGEEIPKDEPELSRQLSSLRQAVAALRRDMLQAGEEGVHSNALKLAEFQRALFTDMHDTFQALQGQDNRSPLRVEDLPKTLRDRFIGLTGKYEIMVYPKKDLWQRANQKEFVEQVQQVDPERDGYSRAALLLHRAAQKELRGGRPRFSDRHCAARVFSFPQPLGGCVVPRARRRGFPVARRVDGLARGAAQSGEHHDPAARHWHRRHQRHPHSQPLCRGADGRASWRGAPARRCWCQA